MEEKSREVVMAISNAARYMDPFFKLSAMGTILLLQYFARMVKERKLKEISDYRTILNAFEGEQVMRTEDGLLALKQKQESMKGRQEALLSGKIVSVLKNAWRYRGEVRGATLVCDLLIVKQKDGDRYEIK